MKYICPVCGFPGLLEPPRGKSQAGSYEICPSCGFQFGVSDDDRGFSYEKWRKAWRKGGMKWSSLQPPPCAWNPSAQLKNLSSRLYEAQWSGDDPSMKTVAIIGASADSRKFGNKAVRAFKKRGYQVFPINPNETELEGLQVFPTISAIPVRPNLVSVYLPPSVLLNVLPDIAAKGCDELWLNPGTESPEVLAEAERLGLNVIQACSIIGVGLSPEDL